MAHNDITARGPGSPVEPRPRASSGITPMAQQQSDLGSPSAPQKLVRLVGCHDVKAQQADPARPEQAPDRSRSRH
jgi:hypothetical protein